MNMNYALSLLVQQHTKQEISSFRDQFKKQLRTNFGKFLGCFVHSEPSSENKNVHKSGTNIKDKYPPNNQIYKEY